MAYEYEKYIKNAIGTEALFIHEERIREERMEELQEVYRKAKAMDEIEQAYWKSNSPEKFAYEFVGIFEKHFSNDMEVTQNDS